MSLISKSRSKTPSPQQSPTQIIKSITPCQTPAAYARHRTSLAATTFQSFRTLPHSPQAYNDYVPATTQSWFKSEHVESWTMDALGSVTPSTASSLIQDPFLQSILSTSESARTCTLQVLSLLQSSQARGELERDDDGVSASLEASQKKLRSQLTTLRTQNRRLAHLVRTNKAHTSESRSEIDALHLNLQNLHYESRHLEGEISACEQFSHVYATLPLISEQDFRDMFPEEEYEDEVALMKARIEHEFAQRKELERRKIELEKRKKALDGENEKRRMDLEKLDSDLEIFIERAKPISDRFERET